jgi:single-stranded-DNA-specific exonuclease
MGLQHLLALAEVDPDGLTEEHISYVIAPRLNALGRLADANPAVEFLTTQDTGQARLMATQLEGMNAQRQLLTEQVYQGALAQIERDATLSEAPVLVLSHPAWPAGVIGIVASRLVERFNRPAVLIAAPPGETGRGSARSVEGLNIAAAIAAQGEMLLNFGGHPMAAGLAIEADRIEEFRGALTQTVREMLKTDRIEPALPLDAYLPLAELTIDLVAELEKMAPFGPGNPHLTLACRDVVLKSQAIFGRRQEHLQLIVEDDSERSYKVLWWNGAGEALPEPIESGAPFDLAYIVRASNYRGFREVQIEWAGARLSERAALEAGWLRPMVAVEDYRSVEEPLTRLRSVLAQREVMVWAEGATRQQLVEDGIAAQDRAGLAPAQALAIWSIPPEPQALQAALERVTPQMVYLFAVDPQADDSQAFLNRLGGLVKHVLRADQGRTRLSDLAAATAQREATVRKGLAWLEAAGHLAVRVEGGDEIGDEIIVEKQERSRPGNLEPVVAQLSELLAETAAYRAYFRRADAEALVNSRSAQNLIEKV